MLSFSSTCSLLLFLLLVVAEYCLLGFPPRDRKSRFRSRQLCGESTVGGDTISGNGGVALAKDLVFRGRATDVASTLLSDTIGGSVLDEGDVELPVVDDRLRGVDLDLLGAALVLFVTHIFNSLVVLVCLIFQDG